MTAIQIENLSKVYDDVVALDNLTLSVRENELFGLLGVNGAGKTTAIKILSTIVKPTSGNAYLYGYSLENDVEKVKSIIGYSTQETAVAKNLTVRENLEFYGSLYDLSKDEIRRRADRLIEDFSLQKVVDKRVSKLSGGYQRKVSIALAMISHPKILFLDEPTLGLDVIARRELWKTIQEINKQTTIVLTTHYLEEAYALADRVAVMANGKVLAVDTPENLIRATNARSFEDAFVKIVEGGVL